MQGSFANMDDLSLTISKTTEDFISLKNNIHNKIIAKNNINNNNNEISKLEITYMSIFNSDKRSNETSTYKKTPINQVNNKENIDGNNKNIIQNYENEKKDSVIKKLNFDLCDSMKEREKSKEQNKS